MTDREIDWSRVQRTKQLLDVVGKELSKHRDQQLPPTTEPDQIEPEPVEVEKSTKKQADVPHNPYSPQAMTRADVYRGGQVYCYAIELGELVLRYTCLCTSAIYTTKRGIEVIDADIQKELPTDRSIYSLGLIPKDGEWLPAMSFETKDQIETAEFTPVFHELVAAQRSS